ncbi:sensor histidine kinase [Brevundimonas sp. SL130]|uniref:sensor histidine kinase n=1 Tax=Brevundimonas sp. SL130 TaxID=2995143 RepID=UPI00226CB7ED|nr:sensor histidine kinase [Brevundimonas sp. SL130]WAC59305.1 CHASE3 domain-containing protein [Brevundimonas sp. SL130]
MRSRSSQNWSRFSDFVRTPSLVRSIAALLILAFVLLLTVNVTSFVMIQRTATINDAIEKAQLMRRASRTVVISMLDAETAQRGFLLTGRSDFLEPFEEAREEIVPALAVLDEGAARDPSLRPYVTHIHTLADAKFAEMDRTLNLTRAGRIGQSIQLVRSGQGKRYMDELRHTTQAFDALKSSRIAERTRLSERFGVLTVVMNAIAGLLVLVLAILSAWVVRRYVGEIQRAREELDALNAGLEDTVRDRTAALTRANDEIQRFAYIVSHDLRAPLVNVMGYTSELEQAGKIIDHAITEVETRETVPPDVVMAVREDMPEAIGFIRASTAKMDRLINAILKLSREGRRNPLPEPLDMTAMVRNIADSVHHQTEASGARIVVEDLPSIENDRLSLEQIFGNLIDNAVKYLEPGRPGEIIVTGEEVAGAWVVYRVADNGRGIAPRDHERIFELFRRSGKQDRAGEGLGLAFVRNSVRRIGGTIDVESELGKGSTFLLKFPKRLILSEPGGVL